VVEPIKRTATFEDGKTEELLVCDEECRAIFEAGAEAMRDMPIEDFFGTPIGRRRRMNYAQRHEWYRNYLVKSGTCEECGEPSRVWHELPGTDENTELSRECVVELCDPCHLAKHELERCKARGHDLTLPNARMNPCPSRPKGQCRECHRIINRGTQRRFQAKKRRNK
jgi:hypothetical protein